MDQISDPLIGEKPQYLNAQAAGRPLKNPISHETLVRARGYRQQRTDRDRRTRTQTRTPQL